MRTIPQAGGGNATSMQAPRSYEPFPVRHCPLCVQLLSAAAQNASHGETPLLPMNDLTPPGDFIPEGSPADAAAPDQSITVTVTPLTSVEQVSRFIAGVGRSPAVREVGLVHFAGESGRFRIVEQPRESVVPALLHLDGFPVEEFSRLGSDQFALRLGRSAAVAPPPVAALAASAGASAAIEDGAEPGVADTDTAPTPYRPRQFARWDPRRRLSPSAPATSVRIVVRPLADRASLDRFIQAVRALPWVSDVQVMLMAPGEAQLVAVTSHPVELRAGLAKLIDPSVRDVAERDDGELVVHLFTREEAAEAPPAPPRDRSIPAAFRDALPDAPDAASAASADAAATPAEEATAANEAERPRGDFELLPAEPEQVELRAPTEAEMPAQIDATPAANGAQAEAAPVSAAVTGSVPDGDASQPVAEPAPARGARAGSNSFTLVAYPFSSFSYLNTFISALSALPGTKYVAPRRFRGGTLHLAVDYAGEIPFASLITQIPEFRPRVVSETDDTLTVVVESL